MNITSLQRQQALFHASPRVRQVAAVLLSGGVAAVPAEAVWGLSCDPFDASAVATLLALKQRPVAKGLIVVAADAEQLAPVLDPLTSGERAELLTSWPGANTWLVPNRGYFPAWVTGDSEEVAVRVTASPVLSALCRLVDGPLVSTSANPGGALPARFGFQVARYFGDELQRAPGQVDLSGKPSTIRRVGSGEVLRA
jgi:L-threonylcarbamoyladenylate synthase